MNNLQVLPQNDFNCLLPTQHEMQVLQIIAGNAIESGMFPHIKSKSQGLQIVLIAREFGVPPMIALSGGINSIKGRVELSARVMHAIIRRKGHSISVKELTEKRCVLIGKRADNGNSQESSYTIEEAQTAGLTKGDNWQKYVRDMLFARALTRLARQLFADCIGTAYIEGEIQQKEERPAPAADEIFETVPESICFTEEQLLEKYIKTLPEEDHEQFRKYAKWFMETYKINYVGDFLSKIETKKEEFQKHFFNWKDPKTE